MQFKILEHLKTIISSYNHIKDEINYLDENANSSNVIKKEINLNKYVELKTLVSVMKKIMISP